MSRVSQPVLGLPPAEACSVGPSAGRVEGPECGTVFVFGVAAFSYRARDGSAPGRGAAGGDQDPADRRGRLGVRGQHGDVVAMDGRRLPGRRSGLVRGRSGPKGPSKLTDPLVAQIVGLEATGLTLLECW